MKRKLYKISILFTSTVIVISSCSKPSGKATNSKTNAVFNSNITYGTMADQDGNTYKTVKIGNQTWMAENLRTTKYSDCSAITIVTQASKWESLTTGAYCNYNNTNNLDTIATYGRLYNWYAVNTGKLAPKGWHVPTDAEWIALINYLIANGYNYDNTTTDNKIAKSMATSTRWKIDLKNAGTVGNRDYPEKQNSSGFSALPSGFRTIYGKFRFIEGYGCWWSTIESGVDNAWSRIMMYNYSYVFKEDAPKCLGYSVRCVKD